MSTEYRVIVPGLADWHCVHEEQMLAKKHGLELVQQKFRDPSGREDIFTFCRKVPGVTVCTITEGGKLVLVGQYKQAIKRVVYEFPAGMVWKGQNYQAEALKELAQETGYQSESIELLCATPSHPGPRKFDTCEHLFVATGAHYIGCEDPEVGEHALEVVEISPNTFIEWREAGKIVSSGTREAFGLALEKGFISLHS